MRITAASYTRPIPWQRTNSSIQKHSEIFYFCLYLFLFLFVPVCVSQQHRISALCPGGGGTLAAPSASVFVLFCIRKASKLSTEYPEALRGALQACDGRCLLFEFRQHLQQQRVLACAWQCVCMGVCASAASAKAAARHSLRVAVAPWRAREIRID